MWRRVNTSNLDEVASAIGSWTKLVWLESPTNPRQQISDIRVTCLAFLTYETLWLTIIFMLVQWSDWLEETKTKNQILDSRTESNQIWETNCIKMDRQN